MWSQCGQITVENRRGNGIAVMVDNDKETYTFCQDNVRRLLSKDN